MSKAHPYHDLENVLNRMSPAAAQAQLGSLVQELIDKHNALCAKLDADATVTDEDYAATLSIKGLKER